MPTELPRLLQRQFVGLARQIMENDAISQQELAARIGCSESWVSRLLREDGNLTLKTAERIAHALGRQLVIDWRHCDRRH